jgi:hypothetical protein
MSQTDLGRGCNRPLTVCDGLLNAPDDGGRNDMVWKILPKLGREYVCRHLRLAADPSCAQLRQFPGEINPGVTGEDTKNVTFVPPAP